MANKVELGGNSAWIARRLQVENVKNLFLGTPLDKEF